MRSGRPATIARRTRAMSWGDITAAVRVAVGGQFVVEAVANVAVRPRVVVLIWKIDAAIVPGVSVSIEAARRLDRDQRRLGDIVGSLKKGVHGMGTVLSAVKRRKELRRLPELVEEGGTSLLHLLAECWLSGRISANRGGSMLEKLRVEVLERVLERVRLGSRDSTLNNRGLDASRGKLGLQEVDRVAQTASVVARELPQQSHGTFTVVCFFFRVFMDFEGDLVLALKLANELAGELRRLQEVDKGRSSSQNQFVGLWNHTLIRHVSGRGLQNGSGARAYQELVSAQGYLPLRPGDSHLVACLLGAWEDDLAVPLLLKLFNLRETTDQLAVIQAVHMHNLRSELGML
jgi:hypothetical protein